MNENRDEFDDMMRELMQEAGLERAPGNFTQAVMGQIAAEQAIPKRTWKPIITRRGWVSIAAGVMVATVSAFLFLSPSKKPIPGKETVDQALSQAAGLFENIQVPAILGLSLVAIMLLFALDQGLSRRQKNTF
jgi:hypothetical protein